MRASEGGAGEEGPRGAPEQRGWARRASEPKEAPAAAAAIYHTTHYVDHDSNHKLDYANRLHKLFLRYDQL